MILFLFQHGPAAAQCGAPVSAFPYHEDFEASGGGWAAGGAGSDWAWGVPAKPTINTAGSGTRCWVTGGLTGSFYSLGQRSYVESPCFDFTQLPYPAIRFKIWWESEQRFDGGSLQYSLDQGATWANVGAFNDPADCLTEHWYNTSSITNLGNLANPRHGWSGNAKPTVGNCLGGDGSNGWVEAKHCLDGLGGKPSVRLRFIFGAGTACNDFDGLAFDDIFIENAPPIVAGFGSACAGNNAYSFLDLSNNCPDAWHWDFGDPASGASNASTLQNPTHTFSGPGIYTVTLQASGACGEGGLVAFPIEVLGLVTSSQSPSCIGGKDGVASAELPSAPGNAVYEWGTSPPQFGPSATRLTAGVYTVTASGPGICPVSATVTVSDPDSLLVPVTNILQAIADTTIALGNSVLLTGMASDPGRVASWQWVPALYLDCDTCLNTLASPLLTTAYTLLATDTNGCVVSDALVVKVLPGSVYLPNVFKPDSGQANGAFTVFADKDVESVELLQIYDRWGSLLFENRDFPASDPAHGWDGSAGGKDAAPGVYLYIAKVRFLHGQSEWYKGSVTVLR